MSTLLSKKAVLVALNISQWSARRLDKKITEETNREHGATQDAGRYNKLLLRKERIEPIQTIVGRARGLHLEMTQPWTDMGPRLLPSVLVIDYQNKMRALRHEFENAVEHFCMSYPVAVEERRQELNGMFRKDDYPSVREIRGRFGFSVEMFNVPDASDFRVAIGEEHVADLRQQIEESTRRCLAGAMRDVRERILETVGHMASKLRAYKPADPENETKAEGVFRDSLVENVRELAELLPAFNLTDDAALAAIIAKMKAKLCEHDADELRENDSARRDVAKAADDILRDVQAFMA
jgi:hypothetical protein